jgi:hypothetical protein
MRGTATSPVADLSYLEIEVRGSPRQIGCQISEAARDVIHESIVCYEEHHQAMAGMSFAEAERKCADYLVQARRWVPQVVEELEGMAAGSGVPLSKLAVPNCGEELTCSDEATLLGGPAESSGGSRRRR